MINKIRDKILGIVYASVRARHYVPRVKCMVMLGCFVVGKASTDDHKTSADDYKASADDHKAHNVKSQKCTASTAQATESENNFSPKNFDTFIHWACRQLASASVVVIRKTQDEYVNVSEKKTSKLKKNKSKGESSIDHIDESSGCFSKACFTDNSKVPITVYYDVNHQLVEISIIGSVNTVPRKVIRAVSLSVPYQTSLKRFTFRRSHLTAALVYEINKLLHISNISDIILDDSYVPEGNYFIFLEQLSHLKYLSLSRCKINDEVCKNIFKNIRFGAPAANTLQILELGSNNITDDGATFIGSVLRANRCLLHLNLSGNRITDIGFRKILDSLMEFELDSEEKIAAKGRKFSFLQCKTAVYARCLNVLRSENFDESDNSITGRKLLMKRLHLKRSISKKSGPLRTLKNEAETMARRIVGEFHDPFSPDNVVLKNDSTYCTGNFVLCSINIAYNQLQYASIRKLSEVLEYQDGIFHTNDKDTGLIRITLDGNTIPQTCAELDVISLYLKKAVNSRKLLDGKKRKAMFQKKQYHQGSRQTSSSHLI